MRVINARYLASAVKAAQYPEGDYGEIAFIGRSNVGKSSLINSLCNHRGLALVSGQPGKTQTINFFSVTAKLETEERFTWFLVDLPGYGYAKRSKTSRDAWSKFIAEYIAKSPRLRLVCQLIDSRHSPMAVDKEAYAWLEQCDVPLQVIATKTDKLSRNELQKNMAALRRELSPAAPIIAYSSVSNAGRDDLLKIIEHELLGKGGAKAPC